MVIQWRVVELTFSHLRLNLNKMVTLPSSDIGNLYNNAADRRLREEDGFTSIYLLDEQELDAFNGAQGERY